MNIKFQAFEPIDLKNDFHFGVVNIAIEKILPDENQPRKIFDNESLEELSSSIIKHGILQPIIVQKLNEEKYQIIAGERRWRASNLAGLKEIPALIKNGNNVESNIAISLIENIQRKELNPIELAEAFYDLHCSHGLTHEAIAKMVGKKRETITNLLRLLHLEPFTKELLANGKIDMGHAKVLLPLSVEHQILVATKILEKKLSVRETENLIESIKKTLSTSNSQYRDDNYKKIQDWERTLSEKLHSKVKINVDKNGKSRIVLNMESIDEIAWLVKRITNVIKT